MQELAAHRRITVARLALKRKVHAGDKDPLLSTDFSPLSPLYIHNAIVVDNVDNSCYLMHFIAVETQFLITYGRRQVWLTTITLRD